MEQVAYNFLARAVGFKRGAKKLKLRVSDKSVVVSSSTALKNYVIKLFKRANIKLTFANSARDLGLTDHAATKPSI